jgi:hypothetical protein
MRRVEADGMADCALQCWKTCLCSNVLSALKLVGEGGWGDAYRGRFLGKPLRAIFRFRHQDTQTPPSPLVGEGGRGDEGQKARECRKPRIAPENSTLERWGDEGQKKKTSGRHRHSWQK